MVQDNVYPIIYVRGYAMTPGEVADAVDKPHMGFNLGATRARQSWDGKVRKQIFESPLVRLMKDYGYTDAFSEGAELDRPIGLKTVVIYRYYDQADKEFGDGDALSIMAAARRLGKLVENVRKNLVDNQIVSDSEFRVHLVAHSMGGLIVRCLLQNESVASAGVRASVARVFTYATPHNGIEMVGLNVPAFLSFWDINNFNRKVMAQYLGISDASRHVNSLEGKFDPDNFFCLVGTNHRDYEAAGGLSRRLAGEMSDGLVAIANATVKRAPRAFVYRSHSGPYGIVNSEEGYQNLVRFLFGDVRVDGILEVEELPLPKKVQEAREAGKQIRASYYFESVVSPRGAGDYRLTERRRETFSAVLRKFDEMFRPNELGISAPRSPVLFSTFLDSSRITVERGRTLVMAVELAVSPTDYLIDGKLWFEDRIPGEYLFRDTIVLRVTPQTDGSWSVRYVLADENQGDGDGRKADLDGDSHSIPVSSRKGFKAKLELKLSRRDRG
ncbi:MAG: esterase/lipase family protein [Marinobacter sp.]